MRGLELPGSLPLVSMVLQPWLGCLQQLVGISLPVQSTRGKAGPFGFERGRFGEVFSKSPALLALIRNDCKGSFIRDHTWLEKSH